VCTRPAGIPGGYVGRSPRPSGRRGRREAQVLVNERKDILDRALSDASSGKIRGPIRWLSPLKKDEWAEYRDETFLDRLEVQLPQRALNDFWPALGPQWAGLGIAKDGARILVEAKAHESEVAGDCTATGAVSQLRIRKSLKEVQAHFAVDASHDWMNSYYPVREPPRPSVLAAQHRREPRDRLLSRGGDHRGAAGPSDRGPSRRRCDLPAPGDRARDEERIRPARRATGE
jgi:hypothetical protein